VEILAQYRDYQYGLVAAEYCQSSQKLLNDGGSAIS
jgi:hypothetical protein